MSDIISTNWIVEEYDPESGWDHDDWEEFAGDYDDYREAYAHYEKLKREWPASKWRIVEITNRVLDES